MKMFRVAGLLILFGTSVLLISGCGGDMRARQALSGDVALDGRPLEKGQIVFQSKSTGEGVTAFGQIADGHFSIDRETGPVPGGYVVRIDSISLPTYATKKSGHNSGYNNLVPSQYNMESTLTADVKADTVNSYKFELASNAGNPKGKAAYGNRHH
jgi:hypothetical protein